MLILPIGVAEQIAKHVWREHPIEACGVISGPKGNQMPTTVYEMENVEEDTEMFAFDHTEQLNVWRTVEERGEQILVVYHSHTNGSGAEPSKRDKMFLHMAGEHVLHLIAGTKEPGVTEFRAWRITPAEKDIREVPVFIRTHLGDITYAS